MGDHEWGNTNLGTSSSLSGGGGGVGDQPAVVVSDEVVAGELGLDWKALVQHGVLGPKERLLLAEPVLCRRIPCLPPRLLLLTDNPSRLIALDEKRRKVRRELPLQSLQIQVGPGEYEFAISSSKSWKRKTYRCAGGDTRAIDWARRIEAARDQLLNSIVGL